MGEPMHRVPVDLERGIVEFLDKLSLDAKYSGGKSIPRAMTIRAALNALRQLDLPPDSYRDPEELLRAIEETLCKERKGRDS